MVFLRLSSFLAALFMVVASALAVLPSAFADAYGFAYGIQSVSSTTGSSAMIVSDLGSGRFDVTNAPGNLSGSGAVGVVVNFANSGATCTPCTSTIGAYITANSGTGGEETDFIVSVVPDNLGTRAGTYVVDYRAETVVPEHGSTVGIGENGWITVAWTATIYSPGPILGFNLTIRAYNMLAISKNTPVSMKVFGGMVQAPTGGGGRDYTQYLDELEDKVDLTNSELSTLDDNTDELESFIDELEGNTDDVEEELTELNQQVDQLNEYLMDESVTVDPVLIPAPDPEPDAGLSDVINSVIGLADVTNLTTCSGGVNLGPMWGHGNTSDVVIPCRTDEIPPVISTAVGVVLSFAMFMPLVWSAYRTAVKMVKGEPDAAIASMMAPTGVVLESIGLPGIEMGDKKGDDD